MHHKIGTPVRITSYAPEYDGLTGVVESRDGEVYTMLLDPSQGLPEYYPKQVFGLYHCELDEILN